MTNDAHTPDDLDPPTPSGGSEGAADFWADIERSYDTEYRHHVRMSRLNHRNMSFAAQQFQSQMLGLVLLGESEAPLIPVGSTEPAQPEAAQTDPIVQS